MTLQTEKLNVASLTGGERQGEGIFEELMRAMKSHLVTEYDAGRITGDNYTNAYVAGMGGAMNTGAQYLLQIELNNQQVRLLDEQIAAAAKQVTLVQSQIDKEAQNLLYTVKQTLKLDSDIALVDSQVLSQGKQLLVMDEQINNAQKDLVIKDSQNDKLLAEELMIAQQTSNELTRNAQISVQTLKITSEQAILLQRAVSEEAQTKDITSQGAVEGIMGRQITLYQNQADGYIRDAEQKAAKIMNDTFITRISTDWDNPNSSVAGVDDVEVAKVMSQLKLGVGA